MIELDQIMRQQGDDSFTKILNRIRVGLLDNEDFKALSERLVTKLDINYPGDAMHIWAENSAVDDHNNHMLGLINEPLITVIANDQYPAKASKEDINKALERGRCATGGLDYRVDLKRRARVMLTTNLDVQDHLINGQIGIIERIKMNEVSGKPEVMYVKFDYDNAGRERIWKSCDIYATSHAVVPIVPILTRIKLKENRPSSPKIQRTQFPLTLAWACTVLKVQGLTLEKMVFSFELFKQRQFNYGQVYVALSRVKSLAQLYLMGDIDSAGVRADPRISEEYQRLRSEGMKLHAPNILCKSNSENIVITLLNVRSLKQHFEDIRNDSKIVQSDIIAFTETHSRPLQNIDMIQQALSEFQILHEEQSNSYLSLAVCANISHGISLCSNQFFSSGKWNVCGMCEVQHEA